ncbi:MAG: transglutaminase family protein [Bacteroidales bacterium]
MLDKELTSLISLLDDDDVEMVDTIINRLCKLGEQIIPSLQSAWLNAQHELHAERINFVIQTIHETASKGELLDWVKSGAKDMLTGVLCVCKLLEPKISLNKVKEQFESIIASIWIELHDELTALEKVNVINQVLFTQHKFTATISQIKEKHLLLSKALPRRNGAHITLSILYTCIAQRLKLPITGVAHPQSTILVYYDSPNKDCLFFIDPLRGGIFGKKKLINIVQRFKGDKDISEDSFFPCSNTTLLYRYVYLLQNFYRNTGKEDQLNLAEETLKIIASKT